MVMESSTDYSYVVVYVVGELHAPFFTLSRQQASVGQGVPP